MSEALSLLLAGTLSVAAVAKLRNPQAFATTIAALGAPPVLVRLVPAAEAGSALALVGGGRAAAAAGVMLLALLTVALVVLDRRSLPCACFGGSSGEGGLGRNVLLVTAAGALVVAPARPIWTVPATAGLGAATAAVGAACVWALGRELAAS